MIKKNKKQKGLTLISLLIASSLLVVLTLYVSVILFNLGQFDLRSRAQRSVISDSQFIVSKINQDIRAAEEITSPVVGESGNQLTLTVDGNQIDYQLNDKNIIRTVGEESYQLNSNQSEIINFQVNHNGDSNPTGLENVNFDLTSRWMGKLREGQEDEYSLSSTVSLRY